MSEHRPGPARLGFAVKVLGRPGLRSHDARRWRSGPHLRVSLGYLAAVFDYLGEAGIRMYRIASQVAPYATHPDLPQFHRQLDECAADLAALGAKARRLGLRLSLHPGQYAVLNSPDERIAGAAAAEFAHHARFLDALGAGPEAKVVAHVGGVYGDRGAAVDRFVARCGALPECARRRLVLEHDEVSYAVPDVLAIHGRTGVPAVFDALHHRVHNPAGLPDDEACRRCLATWPPGQAPKIHFSSPRIGGREAVRPPGGRAVPDRRPARPGQHDDWIDAEDFLAFVRATEGLRYDVMLEAKQKDLAPLRLRGAIEAAGLRERVW